MMAKPHILFVVTSHDRIDEEKPTGIWLSEFAEPYELFVQAGYQITVASVRGGKAPIDPRSLPKDETQWAEAIAALEQTVPLSSVVEDPFDAVFLPGGHGTMYDLPGNPELERILRSMDDSKKIIAAVCHGPAGLVNMKRSDGQDFVRGRRLTAFTNAEEKAAQLDTYMPFLLETRLREQGADFQGKPLWTDHVVIDGHLITGQNPQSGLSAARAVVEQLSVPHS